MKTYFNKFLLCIMAIIIALSSVACVAVKNESYDDGSINNNYAAENQGDDKGDEETVTPSFTEGDVNIYFYHLMGTKEPFAPSKENGDSFIITVGDVEILVDAGSEAGSYMSIMSNMKKHVSADKHWDYIIVTHADYDHIAAFVPDAKQNSVFSLFTGLNPEMTLGTIIDFDITKDDTVTDETFPNKEGLFYTDKYTKYTDYKNEVIETGAKYYTSTQCCWEKRGLEKAPVEGATDRFRLDGDKITLNILYNYFSDHKIRPSTSDIQSVDRNCISVCFSIDYVKPDGEVERFLFTGDLEEFDSGRKLADNSYERVYGETKLIENNPQLLDGASFYKAAHHGSRTSSSEEFINAISPEVVVITAAAGRGKHVAPNSADDFPSQAVTDTLFKYTDRIYILAYDTDVDGKKTANDYYGEIMVGYSGNEIDVVTTASYDTATGKPLPIQDTEWFQKYRGAGLTSIVFSGYDSESRSYIGNCTLVKYGHYDILIDCGIYSYDNPRTIISDNFIRKVKRYCTDGIIEYLIVTSTEPDSIQQLTDRCVNKKLIHKGIMSEFKIENLIDTVGLSSSGGENGDSLFSLYKEKVKNLIVSGRKYDGVEQINNDIVVTDGLTIDVLSNECYHEMDNSDLCFTINYRGKKMLFMGDNGKEAEDSVMKLSEGSSAINDLSNIVYYKVPDYGSGTGCQKEFLDKINDSETLYIVANAIPGHYYFGREQMCKRVCDDLINYSTDNNAYLTMMKDKNGKYKEICGDIAFSIIYKNNGDTSGSPFTYKIDGTVSETKLIHSEYYKSLSQN